MGIADYLLAASLRLVVAQRLVRKLCTHCKQPDPVHIGKFRPNGCPQCKHTGYKGRVAIYEAFLPQEAKMLSSLRAEARSLWEAGETDWGEIAVYVGREALAS